jgi:catechol-2,3-dioxygenase
MPFEFKTQRDYDLHIALEVEHDKLQPMLDKGRQAGLEVRGVSDHGFIHSVYFRDPNGYVIELTARLPNHEQATDPAVNQARAKLDAWQSSKQGKQDK